MTTDGEYRQVARDEYGSTEIEVDPEAAVSRPEDIGSSSTGGAWVSAWLWVAEPEPLNPECAE